MNKHLLSAYRTNYNYFLPVTALCTTTTVFSKTTHNSKYELVTLKSSDKCLLVFLIHAAFTAVFFA